MMILNILYNNCLLRKTFIMKRFSSREKKTVNTLHVKLNKGLSGFLTMKPLNYYFTHSVIISIWLNWQYGLVFLRCYQTWNSQLFKFKSWNFEVIWRNFSKIQSYWGRIVYLVLTCVLIFFILLYKVSTLI